MKPSTIIAKAIALIEGMASYGEFADDISVVVELRRLEPQFSAPGRFVQYEIAPTVSDTEDVTAYDSIDLAMEAMARAAKPNETFLGWAVYGFSEETLTQCICDVNDEDEALDMMYRLTGMKLQPNGSRRFVRTI